MNLESFGRPSSPPEPETMRAPSPELHETYETAHELMEALSALDGFTQLPDQSALITKLRADHLVVRREDPDKLLELVRHGEPIALSFVGGTPYANSVEWNPALDGPRGLDNAYLEGYGHKANVVTVYGFERPDDFYLEKLDDSQRVFNGVDRSRVRAAAGFVPLEAVQFVTVRIPLNALPENELTEEEKDQLFDYESADPKKRKPLFAYRTYLRAADAGAHQTVQ